MVNDFQLKGAEVWAKFRSGMRTTFLKSLYNSYKTHGDMCYMGTLKCAHFFIMKKNSIKHSQLIKELSSSLAVIPDYVEPSINGVGRQRPSASYSLLWRGAGRSGAQHWERSFDLWERRQAIGSSAIYLICLKIFSEINCLTSFNRGNSQKSGIS